MVALGAGAPRLQQADRLGWNEDAPEIDAVLTAAVEIAAAGRDE